MYIFICSNDTLDKSIPIVPNSLSTNDEDDKRAKPEAETSHQTIEVHYMMHNIGSNVDSKTNSKEHDTFEKLPSKMR